MLFFSLLGLSRLVLLPVKEWSRQEPVLQLCSAYAAQPGDDKRPLNMSDRSPRS